MLLITALILLTHRSYGDYGGIMSFAHCVVMIGAYMTMDMRYSIWAGGAFFLAHQLLETAHYSLGSFIVVVLEYVVIIFLSRRLQNENAVKIVPFIVSALVIGVGIGVVDWLISQNLGETLVSLLYNTFQGIVSCIVVLMVLPLLDFIKDNLPKTIKETK